MPLQNISPLINTAFLTESALSKSLGEELFFSESGNMVFHWADFHETCNVVKGQLENDPVLMEDFKLREAALTRLSAISVWIRTQNKVHQSTVHDLYTKYLLNHSQMMGGLDPFCPFDISFISGTGPFKSMSIVDCFNKTTYRDFVLVYLLRGKLPRRDFRVRLKSKVLLEYGPKFNQAEIISLEQLTINGMLFSMDADIYTRKLCELPSVRILINANMLGSGLSKDLSELKTHLSQYAFNLLYSSSKEDSMPVKMADCSVQSSFDFSKNKKVYLFIGYDKFSVHQPSGVKMIRQFVEHTKDLVLDYYSKNNHKLKSA